MHIFHMCFTALSATANKTVSLLMALSAMMICSSAMAVSDYTEKIIELGPINGTIAANQVVEVNRVLSDPVLFSVNRSDAQFMPSVLIAQDVRAKDGNNQVIVLRREQNITSPQGQQQTLAAEYSLQLWTNGKRSAIKWTPQGNDVLIHIPADAEGIRLLSNDPVKMQIPVGHRGDIAISLKIIGEEDTDLSIN